MRRITFLILLLITTLNSFSQEVITCVNDSIKLKTKNYQFGVIEWEKSIDGENWEKIENELDTTYVFKTDITAYYRAVNKLPNCEPKYSGATLVQRPPKANAGFDRLINDDNLFLSGNTEPNSTGIWEIYEGTNGSFEDNTKADTRFTATTGDYKLIWTLQNSCGVSKDTVLVSIAENQYYDKIVIVDETDQVLSTQQEIENGNYTILFSDPVPQIDTETILVGTTERGYLRRVESVNQTDNTFIMTTSQGKLEDILLDGGFDLAKITSLDTLLTSSKSKYKKLSKRPTRKEILQNKNLQKGVHYFIVEENVKSLENNAKLYKNDNDEKNTTLSFNLNGNLVDTDELTINLNGNLTFTPNAFAEYNKKPLWPKFAAGFNNAKLINEFTFNLTSNTNHNLLDKEFSLFNYIKVAYILVGGVPVLVTTDIDFEGKISAEASTSLVFQHTFTNAITANAEISYNIGSGWDKEFGIDVKNNFENNLEISGSVVQKLEIGPKISFKVYDVIGPYAAFKLTEKFKLCAKSTNSNPFNWNGDFDIGSKITAGINAKVLGKDLFDFSDTKERNGLYKLRFPYKLEYFLGNNQQYNIGEPLEHEPTVFISNNKGKGVANVPVKFEVDPNTTDTVSEVYVLTDAAGYARTTWTINSDNSSILRAKVVDCDDKNIGNSPYIFRATEKKVFDCSTTSLSLNYKIDNNILTPIALRGLAPYTYSLDNTTYSSEKPEITLIDNNTYTLFVKDNNECIASISYIHKAFDCNNSNLTIQTSIYGRNIVANVTGGNPPYEYSIDNGISYSFNNTFNNLENKSYEIKVKDANGCTNETSTLINTNQELSAYFEYENNNGLVTFNNLSTGAETYAWDFGDGKNSTAKNPVHFYPTNGDYEVKLTLTDPSNNSNEITINITINHNKKTFQGGITFSSQQEIDDFGENNYEIINGNITIKETIENDIKNFSGLETISNINGFIKIENNKGLSDVSGLYNIKSVDYLTIDNNPSILSINGFHDLVATNGFILIRQNDNLETLEIVNKTSKRQFGLSILGNLKLKSINVFKNTISFNSGINIRTSTLETISLSGFDNLETVEGYLRIRLMENLASIDGFSKLRNVNGDFDLNQLKIPNLDNFRSLKNLSGAITFTNNKELSNFCGINDVFNTDFNLNGNIFQILGNAYNPSLNDLINNKCK